MMANSKNTQNEEYSKTIQGNTILLHFECWIKYIEGFTKGLETTEKVNSSAVLDCIGEILEYLTILKSQLFDLFTHCESVLRENEELKEQLRLLNTPKLTDSKGSKRKGKENV